MTKAPQGGGVIGVTWPIFIFFIFDVGKAKASVAKFCTQIEYIQCKPLDDKLRPSGRGKGHVTGF